MRTIPLVRWIANAAACLTGTHGAVTEQAQESGCSRQSAYDHAQKVLDAVAAQHGGGPTPEPLIQDNASLRRENAQLWDWLCQTIEFPTAKQQEFAVTARAMGLSLNQTRALLALLLGAAAPGRSSVHRWVQAAGTAAGVVLKRLDQAARTLVLVGCLDEIFFRRRPVLVGVEPQSMVWFLGTKAADRKGSTWSAALQPWTALGYVISDAGTGLQAGIDRLQADRLQTDGAPLEKGLDVFHTKQEAHRVLRVLWSRVERLWELAEAASRAVDRAQLEGRDARRGPAQRARAAWKKAETAFRQYERGKAAWDGAEAALGLFRPDGQLNDRSWAQEQVAAALPGFSGSDWSKVRGFLQAPESFTFLDRLHGALGRLAVAAELLGALVSLWWLRRQRRRGCDPAALGGYRQVAPLVQQVLCQQLDPNWRESYRQVAAVLGRAVRASSAVECMNSVLRMHQCRHRTLTQGMLDLKRLYWNTREFDGGKRRGHCPYEHLGLELSSYRFWGLLQDEMMIAIDAAKAKAKVPRIAA
jgi:hypothetical protein